MSDTAEVPPLSTINQSAAAHGRKLHLIGASITALWLIGTAVYAWCVWTLMLQMKPDGFATFLSGVFAPVAFLWLVLGFMQQGDELRHSAQALWLQGEELRNSVEQQRQLVEVSRQQMAAEQAERERAVAEMERSAQPVLTMSGRGASYSHPVKEFRYALSSGGPTCTDLVVRTDDDIRARGAVFREGDERTFALEYTQGQSVAPVMVHVSYVDRNGNHRAQMFRIGAALDGGNWKDGALTDASKMPGIMVLSDV